MRPPSRARSVSAGLIAVLLWAGAWSAPTGAVLAVSSGGPGAVATSAAGVAATDRVIVTWKDARGSVAMAEGLRTALLSQALGIRVRFVRHGANGTGIYQLASRLGSRAAVRLTAMRRVPGVTSVQPDRILRRADVPNDPYASLLWSLLPPSAGGSAYGIDPTAAWPTTTGKGVVVAVVDTGITDHVDLAGQVLPGYDMISDPTVAGDGDGRDPNAADPGDFDATSWSSWHGTHVSGTIAALAGNGIGVFGAAPGVRILPVRALGRGGGYESDIMDAVAWAAGVPVDGVPANTTPARVINLSLAGGGTCDAYSQASIDAARAAGALVVAAAGNEDGDAGQATPANCRGVLAVAATDSSGHRASFSDYGPTVGIAAPGVGILSTVNAGRTIPTLGAAGSVYATYSGTSMAAPHVAAAAALLAAAYPDLPGDAIAAILRASATPFPAPAAGEMQPCAQVGCGAGIVSVPAAFALLRNGPPIVSAPDAPAWTAAAHTVTVRASAASGVGVASAAASIDGKPAIAMAASDGSFGGTSERLEATFPAPAGDGSHTVCVTATSGASVVSAAACTTFGIDGTNPIGGSAQVSAAGVVAGQPVAASRAFTDAPSGIASVSLTWDGTPLPASTASGAVGGPSESAIGIAGGAATSISAGIGQTCVLTPGGGVACWGHNDAGQVGDGTTISREVPRLLAIGGPAIAVAGSAVHGCAVRADHHLVCWGTDSGGQFGTQEITGTPPMEIAGITDAVSVAAGGDYTCVLHASRTVSCLGSFLSSDPNAGSFSADTSSLRQVVAITGGYFAACALIADGTVRCWGSGPLGELGNGKRLDAAVPVAVTGLRDAVAISAGDEFACAIRSDGSVWCWGVNLFGELGARPPSTATAVPPSATVPVRVPGPTHATVVSAGYTHACAAGPDGAWCWGGNDDGEVGTGSPSGIELPHTLGVAGVVSIAAGLRTTCVITAGGAVSCWGAAGDGMLGNGAAHPDDPTARELAPQRVVGFGGAPSVGAHALCLFAADAAGNTSAPDCRTVTIRATTASAPTGVIAAAGSGSVVVSWLPPATDGGSPVTAYVVTSPRVSQPCTVAAAVRSCTFTGLANGLVDVFTVRATTTMGAGAAATAAAIPAVGRMTRVSLATGQLDVAHGRTPVVVSVGTSVPTTTSGLAYRFTYRLGATTGFGRATTGASGSMLVPVGPTAAYAGWATVGGAATPAVPALARTVTAVQDWSTGLRYSAGWRRLSTSAAYGRTLRYASAAGTSVTYRVSGTSVAWVSSIGPNRGRARVYVDGRLRATLDLYARTNVYGRVVWASALSSGTHTVRIVVLGTRNWRSHGTRVDVDALLRMR